MYYAGQIWSYWWNFLLKTFLSPSELRALRRWRQDQVRGWAVPFCSLDYSNNRVVLQHETATKLLILVFSIDYNKLNDPIVGSLVDRVFLMTFIIVVKFYMDVSIEISDIRVRKTKNKMVYAVLLMLKFFNSEKHWYHTWLHIKKLSINLHFNPFTILKNDSHSLVVLRMSFDLMPIMQYLHCNGKYMNPPSCNISYKN